MKTGTTHSRIPIWAWAAALAVGMATVFPYFGPRLEYYPGDLIDARLSMYLLEHGYKWLSGETAHSFFDASFFYPVRGALAYSDNYLGQLWFYTPWRWLGLDRETSFQAWFLIGFGLNFVAAAWVFTRLRFHWFATLLGAYVFTFSQVAAAQIGHSQLLYRFGVPLSWYFLWRFLDKFGWKDLLAALFFLAWQFYCSLYEGYFLVIFLAAFALVTAIKKPIIRNYLVQATTSSTTAQAIVILGFLIALGTVLRPYVGSAGDQEFMAARRGELLTMLPRPISYLLSWPGSYETGWLFEGASVPMKYEHVMFVGLIPWACVLFLLLTARKSGRHPAVLPAILAMVSIIAVTLYVKGFSLYFVLMRLPGVLGIRGVTRWILILLLPFSIAVAQVAHLCQPRFEGGRKSARLAWALLLVAALIVENRFPVFRHSKADAQQRLQTLSGQLPAELPHDALLAYLYPGGEPERQPYELDSMLLAQEKNRATVNGYSGREPRGYRLLRTCADLKHGLSDVAQDNEAFSIRDVASQVIVLGTSSDAPCSHLNAPISVQSEPLPDQAFRAKIEVRVPPDAPSGSRLSAEIRVTNASGVSWRIKGLQGDKYAVFTACRWIDADSHRPLADYSNRFEFPYDLAPGDTASITAILAAPTVPGPYVLGCDVVQELVHWFHDMGSPLGEATVMVTTNGPALEGFLDGADSEKIGGWAWDVNHPNDPVQIELLDGTALIAKVTADRFRQDLLEAHKGNGSHGFLYPTSNRSKSLGAHTIRALVSGRDFELPGSPVTFRVSR